MGVVGVYLCTLSVRPPPLHRYLFVNELTNITQHSQPTMSSREIATLCDKRHDNVMADIRKMLNELGLYAPDFSGTYTTEPTSQNTSHSKCGYPIGESIDKGWQNTTPSPTVWLKGVFLNMVSLKIKTFWSLLKKK